MSENVFERQVTSEDVGTLVFVGLFMTFISLGYLVIGGF